MFNFELAGAWLLGGLAGSALLRGAIWLLSVGNVGPLLGQVPLLVADRSDRATGALLWYGDSAASAVLAVVTLAVGLGLRSYRGWAMRWARPLAWTFVALNAVAATGCAIAPAGWGWSATLLLLYITSAVVAVKVLGWTATAPYTPARPAPAAR